MSLFSCAFQKSFNALRLQAAGKNKIDNKGKNVLLYPRRRFMFFFSSFLPCCCGSREKNSHKYAGKVYTMLRFSGALVGCGM
jgi:hypothetical protein